MTMPEEIIIIADLGILVVIEIELSTPSEDNAIAPNKLYKGNSQ